MHFLSPKANDNTFLLWNHFFLYLGHRETKNKRTNNMRRNKVLTLLKRTFAKIKKGKKSSGHQNTYTNPWRIRILVSSKSSIWSNHQNYYKQYLIYLMVFVNFYLYLPHYYCFVLTGQQNSCIHIGLQLWPHTLLTQLQ